VSAQKELYSVRMSLIENQRARFDYHVIEEIEAGMELFGFEVKSLRGKQGSLKRAWSHVAVRRIWWALPSRRGRSLMPQNHTTQSGHVDCSSIRSKSPILRARRAKLV
jgi:SsrA-binding protein